MLSNPSRLRVFYLTHLSQPSSDRAVYRAICRQQVRSILELGVGVGQRALRMVELAGRGVPVGEVRYTGVDPFEGRSEMDGPGLALKTAHRLLKATGARIQLVPGEIPAALARTANMLGPIDLLVIAGRLPPQQLAQAWFYVPRLLREQSQVFLEKFLPGGKTAMQPVAHDEIETWATATRHHRAA